MGMIFLDRKHAAAYRAAYSAAYQVALCCSARALEGEPGLWERVRQEAYAAALLAARQRLMTRKGRTRLTPAEELLAEESAKAAVPAAMRERVALRS